MVRPTLWAGTRRRRRRPWYALLVAVVLGLALRQVGTGVAEVGGEPLPPPVTRAQVAAAAARVGMQVQAGWVAVQAVGAQGWAAARAAGGAARDWLAAQGQAGRPPAPVP